MPTTKIHVRKSFPWDADRQHCVEKIEVVLHHPDGKIEVAPAVEIRGPSRLVVRPEDPLSHDGYSIGCWVETEAEVEVVDGADPAHVAVGAAG